MTDCLRCPTVGRVAEPATHRMVARGRCLPAPSGTERLVYLDMPEVQVCARCAEESTNAKPDPRSEVRMIAALQRKAIKDGLVFPGDVYTFGFAEIDKTIAVVSVEMRDQIDQGKPTQRVEGIGDHREALVENRAGVQQQVMGVGKDGKPLVATVTLRVDEPIDRQLTGKNGLFSRVDSMADVPAFEAPPVEALPAQPSAGDLEAP